MPRFDLEEAAREVKLHEFLASNRAELLERSRQRIACGASAAMMDDAEGGIPAFFDQLINALRSAAELHDTGRFHAISTPELPLSDTSPISTTAALHGKRLSRLGFTASQIVHAYAGVCQSIVELANEHGQAIFPAEFGIMNRCVDDAIGQAITEFHQAREAGHAAREVEHLGFLAHELRNALSNAVMALQMIKQGVVGFGGKTGTVLERNLMRMRDLVERSLTEVRLRSNAPARKERVDLEELVGEIETTAAVDASSRGLRLRLEVDRGVVLYADRQMLNSAVVNLLQNASKFTQEGTISLRAKSHRDRFVIEVEDACGGLPPGRAEELSRPVLHATTDPRGMGLGLAIAHRAASSHGGRIEVKNLPGKGCVCSIVLPLSSYGASEETT